MSSSNSNERDRVFSEWRGPWTVTKALICGLLVSIPIFLKWLFHLIAPPPPKSVSGQLALITGGSSGIGRAIALELAREGCNIAIVNRTRETGELVAEEIRKNYGVKAIAFQADVGNRQDIARLKREVEESLGGVDILVNNAGVLAFNISLLEGEDEEYQQTIDTNLMAYFWTTRAFLPGMMRRRCGHIVAISSLITKWPQFTQLAYITTKFGNVGFMEGLHKDLDFLGYGDCIKTTTAIPSLVATYGQLVDAIRSITTLPVSNVHFIAREIVAGVLRNRRKLVVPWPDAVIGVISWLPDAAVRIAQRILLRMDNVEEYMKIRGMKSAREL